MHAVHFQAEAARRAPKAAGSSRAGQGAGIAGWRARGVRGVKSSQVESTATLESTFEFRFRLPLRFPKIGCLLSVVYEVT